MVGTHSYGEGAAMSNIFEVDWRPTEDQRRFRPPSWQKQAFPKIFGASSSFAAMYYVDYRQLSLRCVRTAPGLAV